MALEQLKAIYEEFGGETGRGLRQSSPDGVINELGGFD